MVWMNEWVGIWQQTNYAQEAIIQSVNQFHLIGRDVRNNPADTDTTGEKWFSGTNISYAVWPFTLTDIRIWTLSSIKYLVNPDSAKYQAIRLERIPGVVSGHSLSTAKTLTTVTGKPIQQITEVLNVYIAAEIMRKPITCLMWRLTLSESCINFHTNCINQRWWNNCMNYICKISCITQSSTNFKYAGPCYLQRSV